MGYAKYFEDNMDAFEDSLYMKSYSWGTEKSHYVSSETVRDVIETEAYESGISKSVILASKVSSIEARIALIQQLHVLRSTIMSDAILLHESELKNAKDLLIKEYENLFPGYELEINTVGTQLKKNRENLIVQLIDNAFYFISGVNEDNKSEIKLLVDDIKVLINWHNTSKESEMLYTRCNDKEMFEFLYNKPFNKYDMHCSECNNQFIGQTNYCINCYSVRRNR